MISHAFYKIRACDTSLELSPPPSKQVMGELRFAIIVCIHFEMYEIWAVQFIKAKIQIRFAHTPTRTSILLIQGLFYKPVHSLDILLA